jgi:hypothetical protein
MVRRVVAQGVNQWADYSGNQKNARGGFCAMALKARPCRKLGGVE